MTRYKIVILSNQFYDHPLKTNKWHVATELASLGHTVLFVDPPTRFQGLKKLLKFGSLYRFFVSTVASNLTVFSLLNIFSFKPFSNFNTWVCTSLVNHELKNTVGEKTVLWVYHFDFPDLENVVSSIPHDLLIYDVVDEYTAFPEYQRLATVNKGLVAKIEAIDSFFKVKINQKNLKGRDWVVNRELWLAKNADAIFASAPGLVTKFKKILTELGRGIDRVYFVPNSGDYPRFKDAKSLVNNLPDDIKNIQEPRVLFTGALDTYKVNVNLILQAARAYPNYSFVLIGPMQLSDPDNSVQKLQHEQNIHLLGLKEYKLTPLYFAGAQAFIIPYNLNEYTIGGCFPIKFHEALSAGLPTIVTNIPCYEPFKEVCYVAQDDASFIALIKKAIDEDSSEKILARKEVGKNNSWEKKVASQLSIIDTYVRQK